MLISVIRRNAACHVRCVEVNLMEWMKMFCRYDVEGFVSFSVAIAVCEFTNILSDIRLDFKYTHMNTHMNTHERTHTRMHLHHTHTRTHAHTHTTHTHMHVHTHTHTHACTHTYTCMYTHTHACTHTHIHMHVHTHTHINSIFSFTSSWMCIICVFPTVRVSSVCVCLASSVLQERE